MMEISFTKYKLGKYCKLQLKNFLNKLGDGWMSCLIATFLVSIKKRRFSYIFSNRGIWVHKYSDVVIFDRKINFQASLEYYVKEAKDSWLFIYKPKPGNVIFDIGAGKGEDTYYFSKLVGPHGKVVSIEAHPQIFLCLSKFCQYNNLKNVIPLNLAICEKESEVIIDNPNEDYRSTIINVTKGIGIKGVPLDLIVKNLNLDTIDFIKMNIEGAEEIAIHGMTNCIKKTRYICISCHDYMATHQKGIEQTRIKNKILAFLKLNNFNIISRENDHRPWIRDQLNGINENLILARE